MDSETLFEKFIRVTMMAVRARGLLKEIVRVQALRLLMTRVRRSWRGSAGWHKRNWTCRRSLSKSRAAAGPSGLCSPTRNNESRTEHSYVYAGPDVRLRP